ncbi:unnamed protein product, partial [Symbiodinium microadriaticum]
ANDRSARAGPGGAKAYHGQPLPRDFQGVHTRLEALGRWDLQCRESALRRGQRCCSNSLVSW